MAQFTFTNNTYAGEALAGFMASTLLEADSVKRGLLTVLNDVKARQILLDVDDDVKLQDPSAMFHDQGTTASQNETYLDPIVFEFMKQEQWDKLIQTWEVSSVGKGSMADYDGVVELSDFMVQRYLTKIQIANERLYWLGKSAVAEFSTFTAAFTGLLPAIAAEASAYKVNLLKSYSSLVITAIDATGTVTVGSTANLLDGDVLTINVTAAAGALTETTQQTIKGRTTNGTNYNKAMLNNIQSYYIVVTSGTTFKLYRNYNDLNTRVSASFTGTATAGTATFINVSNVLKVLATVYAQLDPADRLQADFHLQIPLHMGYAYAAAQAAAGVNVLGAFSMPQSMDYLGVKLELMNHWQANTILGARTQNLFLGVDLLGDQSSLKTASLTDATLDNVVRMKARMKAAVNYQFGNELFLVSGYLTT